MGDTMLLHALGERLRGRRLALGLTQADVAERAAVSKRFLVQLEGGSGNISVQRLAGVCSELGYPLEELFRGLGPGASRSVALVGLRGAGKSTVGRALARRLGFEFVELDRRVEELAGMTLAEIFELRGEGHYRQLEHEALRALLGKPSPVVLAAGGSLPTAPEAWRLLRDRAVTVWLRASPRVHLERVRAQGDLRPMRGRPDALGELEAILAEREPLYGQAEVALDTEDLGVNGAVDMLLSRLGEAVPSPARA